MLLFGLPINAGIIISSVLVTLWIRTSGFMVNRPLRWLVGIASPPVEYQINLICLYPQKYRLHAKVFDVCFRYWKY